jgi:hypothetical protein
MAAMVILDTRSVLVWLPALLVLSIPAGLFSGFIADRLLRLLPEDRAMKKRSPAADGGLCCHNTFAGRKQERSEARRSEKE